MLAPASLLLALAASDPSVPPAPPGLLASGNYAYLSPGFGGFVPVADAGLAAYAWSLGAGQYYTPRKRLALALGGFAEHLVLFIFPGEYESTRSVIHGLRLGPELRLGKRHERFFMYGLARLGLDLYFDRAAYGVPVFARVMGTLGGGAQILFGRRFLLGGDGGFDLGGEAFCLLRVRLLLGLRF